MDRVNAILRHPLFIEAVRRASELEAERRYCRHDMAHLIDEARIAYILCLEAGLSIAKETVYAAALLHDTGKARQYEDGTPHEQESARIAAVILPECGFIGDESKLIIDAILAHRDKTDGGEGFLGVLRRADKLSRRCWECAVIDGCNWPEERKNKRLEY